MQIFGAKKGWDVEDGSWAPIPSETALTSVYDKLSSHYSPWSADEDLPDWATGARITHERMGLFAETMKDRVRFEGRKLSFCLLILTRRLSTSF
jgi:hypothetical protein